MTVPTGYGHYSSGFTFCVEKQASIMHRQMVSRPTSPACRSDTAVIEDPTDTASSDRQPTVSELVRSYISAVAAEGIFKCGGKPIFESS